MPEVQIRRLVKDADDYEKQANWEKAREIYELLLSQNDPGLRIRDRYHHVLRRCWQVRRHQDPSYTKEVLSVEYGQALRLYKIISRSLLEGSVEKKKLDPTRLFRKGLEELDAALADPVFLQHVPVTKHAEVPAFRAMLKKTWSETGRLSREEAAKQIGEIAMAAEIHLGLSATVVAMEFACGACYAIDEYTVYLTPNQLRELAQSLTRNEAVGVGLMLAIRDNRIVIHDIVADQARELMKPNDQILSVDKKNVVDLPLQTVKEMLEGPAGSMVEIEIQTPGETSIRSIRLMRSRGMIPSVGAPILLRPHPNATYGYLKLNSFTDTTAQDIDDAIASMSRDGMKALILDLRQNNGGLFDSAIETARKFLSSGIITSTLHQDSKKSFVYHAKNPNAVAVPLMVLVDNETASAAEVLAGALKDNNRATLIGQTTFGKGCTQSVLSLPPATGNVPTGGMRLTVARFFSPKGVSYSARGIVPHFIIDDQMIPGSQAAMMGDRTLAKAIDELNRMMPMPK